MSLSVSVIIPTYNPAEDIIAQTLGGLKKQTLDINSWELIIVDNNSDNDVLSQVDISWHPNAKIIKEPKQGLTYSRIAGTNHAASSVIVMADDDNILAPDYLTTVLSHFSSYPNIGAIGGKITGEFKTTPAEWTNEFWGMLAIRDLGDAPLISSTGLHGEYPACSPVGAGMAVRKHLFDAYIKYISSSGNKITDRSGAGLSSGGDNEINIHVLKQGFAVAYFPDLLLKHIIPPGRLTKEYLARLNRESSRSWIQLLLKYNICPWKPIPKWTAGLRKLKAWFTFNAGKSAANYVKWRGACGMYEGLSEKQ